MTVNVPVLDVIIGYHSRWDRLLPSWCKLRQKWSESIWNSRVEAFRLELFSWLPHKRQQLSDERQMAPLRWPGSCFPRFWLKSYSIYRVISYREFLNLIGWFSQSGILLKTPVTKFLLCPCISGRIKCGCWWNNWFMFTMTDFHGTEHIFP